MNIKSFLNSIKFVLKRRIGEYIIAPLKISLYRIRYSHVANPDKTITIQIRDIQYWYTGNRFDQITFPGEIRDGDWSDNMVTRETRLKNRSCYIGVTEHFKDGVPWRETRLFREKHKMLFQKHDRVKGAKTMDELEQHYISYYDGLFEGIKKDSLLPASPENPHIDPIYVHIGPEGEIIYTVDGNHRLYMAMILGIQEMPVKVWMRHASWQKIRDKLLSGADKNPDPELEKYRSHPDIVSES